MSIADQPTRTSYGAPLCDSCSDAIDITEEIIVHRHGHTYHEECAPARPFHIVREAS